MKYFFYILFLVCIFGFFSVTHAQLGSVSTSGMGTDINVEITPENPGPNTVVSVSLTSYSTDINSANITWKIDGKTQKFGTGEKSFSFATGDMNTTTTLDIVVETQGGEIIEKTFKIKPVGVDLIWESEGFVPPFYKGKSLFSHQNKITIIALPHITSASGAEIGAKNLIYTWKRNGSVVDDVSGFGKNNYSFVSPIISRAIDIEVNVTSPDTSGTGYASITINPAQPFVIFYKKDPVLGIVFQNALHDTVTLSGSKELAVIAMPFFFGTLNSSSPELVYKWSINGTPINNDPNQTTQVFRQQEGTSGTSKIGLSIENTNKILQYTSSDFNLVFGNTN